MLVPASYVATLLILFIAGNFNSYFDIPALLYGKQLNSLRFAIFMHAGSYVHPVAFAPSIVSFLKHIPEAVWFAIARPYPTELPAFWMFPFSIEWILLLVIIAVFVGCCLLFVVVIVACRDGKKCGCCCYYCCCHHGYVSSLLLFFAWIIKLRMLSCVKALVHDFLFAHVFYLCCIFFGMCISVAAYF